MRTAQTLRRIGLLVSLAIALIQTAPVASQVYATRGGTVRAARQFWVNDIGFGQEGHMRLPTFTWERTRE
jgi:hypothetical protein